MKKLNTVLAFFIEKRRDGFYSTRGFLIFTPFLVPKISWQFLKKNFYLTLLEREKVTYYALRSKIRLHEGCTTAVYHNDATYHDRRNILQLFTQHITIDANYHNSNAKCHNAIAQNITKISIFFGNLSQSEI